MLGPLFSVAILVAVAAPLLLAVLWRVPFGALSVTMVVRAALRGATWSVILALALQIYFADLRALPRDEAGAYAASLGGLLAVAALAFAFARKRTARGALLLALRAREPASREASLAALRALLARVRPKGRGSEDRYAEVVLLIVAPLTQAGAWTEAERMLEAVTAASLGPRTRALHAQALATCRLERGDVRGARSALDAIDGPSGERDIDAWLETTAALVLAVDGEPERALATLGTAGDESNPLLLASRRIVRAHAEAALGREEQALAELERTREEVGPAALARALTPEGPASNLARRLLGRT